MPNTSGGSLTFDQTILSSRSITKPFEGFGQRFAATDNSLVVGLPNRRPIGSSEANGGVEFFARRESIWSNEGILDPANGGVFERYGQSLAMDQDTIAISAPLTDTATQNNGGRVYLFNETNQGWELVSTLEMPVDGDPRDGFGSSLSLEGDLLAVSTLSDFAPTRRRRVFLYQEVNGTWEFFNEVVPGDSDGLDDFGLSLSLSGTQLAVGAPADDPAGTGERTGSVSIYKIDTRANSVNLTGTMFLDEGKDGDLFGRAVSLLGNEVLVGAPEAASVSRSVAGEAFLFEVSRGPVEPLQVFLPSNGASGDDFGSIVQLGDRFALVAAEEAISPIGEKGVAYVFERRRAGVSNELTQLFTPGEVQGGSFTATMSGGRIALGYSRHLLETTFPTTLPGAVFLFQNNGASWPLEARLDYPGEVVGPGFGSSIALGNRRILVGAFSDRPLLPNGDAVTAGSAFLFEIGSTNELYDIWAEAQGLTGAMANPGASPRGTINLIDYAFGIRESTHDPSFLTRANRDVSPFSIEFVELPDGGGPAVKVTFNARRSAGITYTPQFSQNLRNGTWQEIDEAMEVTFLDFNFDRREYLEPISGNSQSVFVRVKIELGN
jgi:hypothetical protein